jgi:thiol-disulfide isomerase/thioredoxin
MVRRGDSWSGHERNCVFLNCGQSGAQETESQFANISAVSGLDFPDDGRAVAVTDWDQDGDLDLWLANRTAPRLRLMLNRSEHSSSGQGYVAFRLEGNGRATNRDAIGAMVELDLEYSQSKIPHPKLVQTLRAGEGFLSQNSKWLHFGLRGTKGLGENQGLETIVHWPGDRSERFTGIEPNHRYLLRQGSGRAELLTRAAGATRNVKLTTMAMPPEPPPSPLATILPGKFPLPELAYSDRGGARHVLQPGAKPLLLLFWASWCPSCLHEMQQFTEQASRVEEAGLDILALSVDHLHAGGVNSDLQVTRALEKIGFAFETGRADSGSLERLQRLQEALFERHPDFAVPFGCLLDRQRRLVAVYRGPVPVEVLLADLVAVEASADRQRDLAVPFPGRWYTQAVPVDELAAFAGKQLVARYPLESAGYFEQAASLAAGTGRERKLADTAFTLLYNLARHPSTADPEQLYERAVALKPNSTDAYHDWGVLLARLGRRQQAEAKFRRALEIQPNNDLARQNLELLLRESQKK